MALNLSPEQGVKLTKKDRYQVLRKMRQGWKANCLIPDYVFDENGDIQIGSPNNRRVVKIVKILDDGIHFEKALKSKTLRIPWDKTSNAFNMRTPNIYIAPEDLQNQEIMSQIAKKKVDGCYIFEELKDYTFLKEFTENQ